MKNLSDRICKAITIVTVVGLSLLFVTPFAIFFTALFSDEIVDPMIYVEGAEFYNTEDYPLYETLFLKELPQEAEAVDFSYYLYYTAEEEDTYLELKFNSLDEMQVYLDTLTATLVDYYRNSYNETQSNNGEWFIECPNPYNEKYTDLFSVVFDAGYCTGADYTGYVIEKNEDLFWYKCDYGIISYSYEELTVIQTSSEGWFCESVHGDYVPKYLKRFNVPLNEEHIRKLVVED